MFSIGEFARHGRVSVRMLRHYDTIGLLRPACDDPVSGYRLYQASQLAELNRVIVLKDLGFTLEQVIAILGERVRAHPARDSFPRTLDRNAVDPSCELHILTCSQLAVAERIMRNPTQMRTHEL